MQEPVWLHSGWGDKVKGAMMLNNTEEQSDMIGRYCVPCESHHEGVSFLPALMQFHWFTVLDIMMVSSQE